MGRFLSLRIMDPSRKEPIHNVCKKKPSKKTLKALLLSEVSRAISAVHGHFTAGSKTIITPEGGK